MLFALTSGQKTGLAVVAAVFVVFALSSSFLFPRLAPDFPGRWLKLFVVVCILFTIGMLAAVIGFGKESEEKGAEGTQPTQTVPATQTVPGTTTPPASTQPPPAAGDPAKGKALFASNGCGSCHTYTPAGSNGKVGPNLDDLAASAKKAGRGTLQEFVKESIVDPNAYIAPGFQPNIMPPSFGKSFSDAQIADLVAFLTQGT